MSINCYAAMQPKAALEKFSYNKKPLGASDIVIKISHCGICHSDLHLVDNEWGLNNYPVVPGHEIIGTVLEVGANVLNFTKGQLVGVGWLCGSCGQCQWCFGGEEHLCAKQQATCVGNYGGFADMIQVDHKFAFPVPANMAPDIAAPLLCAGITVFSPLKQYITKVKESNEQPRVAVVGIGGLGHLALQFAKALGAHVTAISSSPEKEAAAKEFGASEFLLSSNDAMMQKAANSFDLILSTASAPLDWSKYVRLLNPRGVLCIVSGLNSKIDVPVMSLIQGRKTICGSNIGGSKEIAQMLEFAAKHGIKPQVEPMLMREVNEALDKLRSNDAYYRIVLMNDK